jgi:hypothetical protein
MKGGKIGNLKVEGRRWKVEGKHEIKERGTNGWAG